MSLTQTVSAERIHIGFFGLRNAGKSSLCNAVTGQALSLVSDVKGTTTDPVQKAMELLPLGPVVIIDTPGLDDEGELGSQRVARARRSLDKCHLAVLVADATLGLTPADRELLEELGARGISHLIAYNKSDLLEAVPADGERELYVSAKTGAGVEKLKNALAALAGTAKPERRLLADLVSPGDTVVLVTPIDESAPKGRIILPQQQTIRELLDCGAFAYVCGVEGLPEVLGSLSRPPRMVITDSQAFGAVSALVPPSVPLTSFSILFARYKGDLATAVRGAALLSSLRDGDAVLISEGCTHHRQCNDIGTVKLPGWIEAFCGAKPAFSFTSGGEFPADLSPYRLVVHCGACMLNEREMAARQARCREAGVPITNYGIAIACMHGILSRSLQLFPDVLALLEP